MRGLTKPFVSRIRRNSYFGICTGSSASEITACKEKRMDTLKELLIFLSSWWDASLKWGKAEASMVSETYCGFSDCQDEAEFNRYLARNSRGTSVLLNLALAIANFTAFPKILAQPLAPRRIIAVAFIIGNISMQIWAGLSLKANNVGRHQSIKALVVRQNQITQIVVVVFLNSAEMGIRHPLSVSLVQAFLIGIFQCPLSITLHMYLVSLLGSFFMVLNAYLETPPEHMEGRMLRAGRTMLGCLLFACVVPLHRSATQERAARAAFLREVRQQPSRSGMG